jgi:hypothetical protein
MARTTALVRRVPSPAGPSDRESSAARAEACPADGERPAGLRARSLEVLGLGFFGLGAVGIALPLLPTTIFWLLAAVLWARSAPHRVRWLFAHPRFGPPVRTFVEQGALSRRGKVSAVLGMGGGLAFAAWSLGPESPLLHVLGLALLVSAIWVVTRPAPGPSGSDAAESP